LSSHFNFSNLDLTPDQMTHTYEFNVKMTCSGCSGAVTRVLDKATKEGDVSEFSVNLENQMVIVKSPKPIEDIKVRIEKTRKEIISYREVETVIV